MKFTLAALIVTATSAGFTLNAESQGGDVTAPEVPQGAPLALAFGDYDADGVNDVYALNPQGGDRLYRSAGDGVLVDVTVESGLAGVSGSRRALFADWDADGLEDLVVLGSQGTRLFKNLGGTFVDITAQAGVQHTGLDLEAAWIDYDGDGMADLYIEQLERVLLYKNVGGNVFVQIEVTVPILQQTPSAPGTGETGAGDEAFTAPGGPGRAGAPASNGSARWKPSGNFAVPNAPGRVGIDPASTGGGQLGVIAGGGCASRILDYADGSSCVLASSEPTEGMLYPLGEELFIESGTGSVGIGTLYPEATLHVKGPSAQEGGSLMVTPGGGGNTNGNNSELWLAEDSDGTFRMGLRYDGAADDLYLLATEDGGATERGPFMTVSRITGDMSLSGILDVDVIEPGDGRLDVNGQTWFVGEESSGLTNPIVYVENEHPNFGTAISAKSHGSTGGAVTPTIYAHNDSSLGGTAISAVAGGESPDAPVLFLRQVGGGPFVNCANQAGSLFQVTNTGRTVTTAVDITGGGDLVEGFESKEGPLEPGTVVIIDVENPGLLMTSHGEYDHKVAGVVSGAAGVNHGIRMGQGGVMDGENLVAMTGRVYVKCSAENGAIQPGDLLTTSDTAGHAMRADDPARSFGTVIGKAMTRLEEGEGLVLVLVNLQ